MWRHKRRCWLLWHVLCQSRATNSIRRCLSFEIIHVITLFLNTVCHHTVHNAQCNDFRCMLSLAGLPRPSLCFLCWWCELSDSHFIFLAHIARHSDVMFHAFYSYSTSTYHHVAIVFSLALYYYLRQGGIKFATVYLSVRPSVCLSVLPSVHPFVSRITLILLVQLFWKNSTVRGSM